MRHLSRHLHATIPNQVEAHLVATGWLTDGTPGFVPLLGALPVEYLRQRPDENILKSLKPNMVAVSFGGRTDDEEEQLGGGLLSHEHVVFVDVYAENDAVASALTEDIRDLFAGRFGSRYFQLIDQATTTPVPGYLCEYDEIFMEPADRELPKVRWHIVRGTVLVEMPGDNP
jgi:hypothetical protein